MGESGVYTRAGQHDLSIGPPIGSKVLVEPTARPFPGVAGASDEAAANRVKLYRPGPLWIRREEKIGE